MVMFSPRSSLQFVLLSSILLSLLPGVGWSQIPACLPGELSAEQVLNGEYPFPPSPAIPVREDASGLATARLSKVPAPGIHPRILLSPEDLPDLRRRLTETQTGKALSLTLTKRIDSALHNPKDWSSDLYAKLSVGDAKGAAALVQENHGFPPGIGHYQPWVYGLVMEAFDSMVHEDHARGAKVATAIATYTELIQPDVEKALAGPLNDDVWRARVGGPVTGDSTSDQGVREVMAGQALGYAYDFSYNDMTPAQRDVVRKLIARATTGKVWMGARLPHHFRNWNWIMVAMGQPLLALAIEGEEGYDPRVYKMGVQIARDYLTYGISEKGVSVEAVGYTQFGFVWGNPFYVAASRRGDTLLANNHLRAMLDWYLASLEPTLDHYTSHGDGGDAGVSIGTLSMFHYFYPNDARADFLWQSFVNHSDGKAFDGTFPIIESLLWSVDGTTTDYENGAKLNLPTTFFDPTRSSLIARSGWDANATTMQLECRTDSVGGNHEHADRGAFTFFSMGRAWAKENFRSVETRHHNSILIDGQGQGMWPGPGEWLGLQESGDQLTAACDAKEAYHWWWPKQAMTEPADFVRYQFARWESYAKDAADFRKEYAGTPLERDTRPSVVAHWKGFEKGDPRMWDEDSWPVRLPFNPVQRAFRSVTFSKGKNPYLLVIDDIQKDDQEHLYEWLMQTGLDTEMVSLTGSDIVLCNASVKRDANGLAKPEKGARELLVRVLNMNEPAKAQDYTTRPSFRLETIDRKDTLVPEAKNGALSGSRSYGLDKRLVIASRSVSPDFQILLFPIHAGDALPVTTWNDDHSVLTVEAGGQKDIYTLHKTPEGRTTIQLPSK